MSDTPLLKKYIESVDGMAHQSAIEIIINLEKKLETAYEDGYENGYQAGMAEKKEWVGLTGTEVNHIFAKNVGYPERMMKDVENLLKDKNGG